MPFNKVEQLNKEHQELRHEIDAIGKQFNKITELLIHASYAKNLAESKRTGIINEEKKDNEKEKSLGFFVAAVGDLLLWGGEMYTNNHIARREELTKIRNQAIEELNKKIKSESDTLTELFNLRAVIYGKAEFLNLFNTSFYTNDYTPLDRQKAEIEFKLKYPCLHQVNILTSLRDLTHVDKALPIVEPIAVKDCTHEMKAMLPIIKALLAKDNEEKFFNSKGVVTFLFGSIYSDSRIDGLKKLISNPCFSELSDVEQLNLIRYEIKSTENRMSSLAQKYQKNMTQQNNNRDRFIFAIENARLDILQDLQRILLAPAKDEIELVAKVGKSTLTS